jgi:hypothetical protein
VDENPELSACQFVLRIITGSWILTASARPAALVVFSWGGTGRHDQRSIIAVECHRAIRINGRLGKTIWPPRRPTWNPKGGDVVLVWGWTWRWSWWKSRIDRPWGAPNVVTQSPHFSTFIQWYHVISTQLSPSTDFNLLSVWARIWICKTHAK